MALVINSLPTNVYVVTQADHDVARINSVSANYPKERTKSKAPTFALTL